MTALLGSKQIREKNITPQSYFKLKKIRDGHALLNKTTTCSDYSPTRWLQNKYHNIKSKTKQEKIGVLDVIYMQNYDSSKENISNSRG